MPPRKKYVQGIDNGKLNMTNSGFDHAEIEVNNRRLHVVQTGPEEGDLVILLHGFP